MRKLIALFGLLFLSLPAFAGTATLSCAAPTTYEGGTAIPAGTAITYKFYRGTSAANVAASTTPIGTAATCAFTDTNAPVGTVFYAATATVGGTESKQTAAVSVVITNPVPNPPSALTVVAVIAGTNFSPVFRVDERGGPLQRAAGLVEAGAACFGPVLFSRDGHPYRRITAKDVDVWFSASNGRLAAACG